ncbi:6-bladed beta-propeller [Flavobacterium limnophilum]|uniref:6-bladed beta-propeller n=1 Tax=Flavobacterium limnophilum TaxID=3003262 RepID=UPI002482E71A|nr:6-bladed beta-propeller [Flavobacterium limnophilum]
MKNIPYKKIYTTIVATIFISCGTVKNEQIETIKVDIKSEKSEIEFADYFSKKNVVVLETNENSTFSYIDRLFLFDNKIFIFDRKLNSVFVFSNNGSFLFKINNIGHGPNEYQGLVDFTIDEKNNNIILHSHRPYALYVYKLDGSFVKKVKLNDIYKNIASIDNKLLFLNADQKKEHLLFDYDMRKNEKKMGSLEMNDLDKQFAFHGIIAPYLTKDKNIHLCLPYSETIYEQNGKGVEAKYHIDFGNEKMPEDIYKSKKNFRELIEFGRSSNYGWGISNFRENKDYITFYYQLCNLVIYSKKDKKAKIVLSVLNDDMIYGSYIAHDGDDNNLVMQCPAYIFKKQMGIYKQNGKWEKLPDNIKKIDNSIKDTNNPLLLIYTFK